jgi:hypothetical protein
MAARPLRPKDASYGQTDMKGPKLIERPIIHDVCNSCCIVEKTMRWYCDG